jgi:hypothetical protein
MGKVALLLILVLLIGCGTDKSPTPEAPRHFIVEQEPPASLYVTPTLMPSAEPIETMPLDHCAQFTFHVVQGGSVDKLEVKFNWMPMSTSPDVHFIPEQGVEFVDEDEGIFKSGVFVNQVVVRWRPVLQEGKRRFFGPVFCDIQLTSVEMQSLSVLEGDGYLEDITLKMHTE